MNSKPMGRNDRHVVDYSQITKHIIVGSNLCDRQICPIHGQEFKDLDVCVEINLDNQRREIPPEQLESYTWIPVIDGHAPRQVQLDIGSAIMDIAAKNNKKVYIHCKNGHARGPTMVVAYFIKYKGMTVSEAEQKIKDKRPEIHIEDIQRKALDVFEKKWLK